MTIASDTAATASVHPLIAQLFSKRGYAEINAESIDAFAQPPGHALLVFIEDPLRVRETLDLAVIVPELVAAFPAAFRVGVLLPQAARQVQARYGFRRWPALVVLRDGAYIGAIDGLRGWEEYLREVARLLEAAPTRPPTVGVTVKNAGPGNAGCGP
jgi:hydrogenase-1 operon protein HyaE